MTITPAERDALYKVLFARRDVRGQFTNQAIDDEVLQRVLTAAHHAPSVGFMQPWDFIIVKDPQSKMQIKQGFDRANAESQALFPADKQQQYQRLKLEGICEAPIGICVTCDPNRTGPVVLGRTIKPQMDDFSVVCAIQNLWLAARAENLGLGWVSILHDEVLRETLAIPESIRIIAYLCLGHVSHFAPKPELETFGWLPRESLDTLVHYERCQAKEPS